MGAAGRRLSEAGAAGALIASLARAIRDVLDPLIPEGVRCALVDFPAHPNVGDSALWLAERAYLRQRRARVVYLCQHETYSRRTLARCLGGDGMILLHGGGNLGDLWPHHQAVRERVLTDFPDTAIVQFPQSIHFQDPANLSRARRLFEARRRLTLLLRDRHSLDLARDELNTPGLLCPDMAFALGPLSPPSRPSRSILWLMRSDAESWGWPPVPLGPGEERVDWLEESRSATLLLAAAWTRAMVRHPRAMSRLMGPGLHLHDAVAQARLHRGCATLSRGRVVITDRLHGHVLALFLGLPHVVLDNSYSKIRHFFETWTSGCELTRWAESPGEAQAQARALLHAAAVGPGQ